MRESEALGTSEAAIEQAEKRGYDTGLEVEHPLIAGARLPLWVANFVLIDYGTGAIFAVLPVTSVTLTSPANTARHPHCAACGRQQCRN